MRRTTRLTLALSVAGVLVTCSPPPSMLAQLAATKQLTMATVRAPTTYALGPHGPEGFAYDLGRRFAQSLGATLAVLVVPNRRAAIQAVASGQADFAAAAISPDARERVRFTPSHFSSQPQVVVHRKARIPDSLAALDGKLVVAGNGAVAAWLRAHHGNIDFRVDTKANAEELLARVASGEIAATIADNNVVNLNLRYYPTLRVAFALPTTTQRAWAFPSLRGDGLFEKAVAFCARMHESGFLRVVTNRYFGHAERLAFVDGRFFAEAVEQRLGRWRSAFQQAAADVGFDWRLLAAIGYQESLWNPDAVSPTGVEGMMMLTEEAAAEVGVEDREDPRQSIRGGAKYIRKMRKRLPDAIAEPDRTWMALASYNIGLGHLMDARRLLKARGRDPNLWVNVREALIWLTEERYHSETRYGPAHGDQTVTYVGKVRAYYDILQWLTREKEKAGKQKPAAPTEVRNQPTPLERLLAINSPVF